ncbi:hypothetical protein IKF89_01765 [Candidatus Saccharibacteria bacterium]|nr:hypothetical protein [Candidatus Saccharibacteria bacterium]
MKKSIIAGAGAAAFGLAVIPFAGVSASTQTITITDTIQPTVSTACEFTRTGEAYSTAQTGVSNVAWSDATGTNTGTYSATITPGSLAILGTSEFTGYCNATNGFSVTVAAPNLTKGEDTIQLSTAQLSAGDEGYTVYRTTGTAAYLANGGTLMSANAATTSTSAVTASVQYTVGTATTTEAGTYSGNVVYTFSYDDPNVSGS